MNPTTQRIKIAEACGAKWYIITWLGQPKQVLSFNVPTQNSLGPMRWELPDDRILAPNIPNYLNSLDAMAEARKSLSDEEHAQFRTWVWRLATDGKGDTNLNRRKHFEAVASIQAEAFLRTKGLWEEDK